MHANKAALIQYIHNFYGKDGNYPLQRSGKYLTKTVIKQTLPLAHTLMAMQKWKWAQGDSMDREFIRAELYEKVMGYTQGEKK